VILVDTSVWIDHLRVADRRLAALLLDEQVLSHRFIDGEIACGALRRRSEVLTLLRNLPHVAPVGDGEAMAFVEAHALAGSGVGWVDVHLLASTYLSGDRIWSKDRPLLRAAQRLGIAA
jgi:predicted nucleic acid-binding protein